ncbi:bifunctional phosphoribosyl-AMP cyclohydrolase/phosphoribosyl-ATP diphosphatase HisIE [Alkalibaculum sp. M08DMB]|uniref:Histidine biosynthesis bifunctional protein HisIE n=1 Tax=Alkalibaculum sporogenes TaxID=2655001 RepID=A0A6A7K8E1_9FIRM|nr:bifunctional phosphoribosyl-AMP cyclohydrolase/phosphoribosyl-ATP diphosphatase HisIE [Alkalibaculum sporogenes]MPW25353.1 bifunctional phosphoribosyl-AMP cyclohydrolase/phosphoribosyl-ATP diphosphatase HisIE [Alkalibaculum sporogenes]
MIELSKLKYNENGLLPAIIQDDFTNEVLMLAYMNEESLQKTISTKKTWFYSRSRKKLWNKGETSGNFQQVKSIKYDCDADTLLIKVKPTGPSCHTGENSCFYTSILESSDGITTNSSQILDDLYKIIVQRKEEPQEGSYTNYLFNSGIDKILKKVGEENAETIIAAKNNSKEELIYETSDLFYHLLVLLVNQGVTLEDIYLELQKRHK